MLRNRLLSIFVATSYLLAVSCAALFHNHAHNHEDHDCCSHESDRCDTDHPGLAIGSAEETHDCSVCQFLAQKPAPAATIAPIGLSLLFEDITPPRSASVTSISFGAWQSRAPPFSA